MRFTQLLLGHHDDHSITRISTALDSMDPPSRLWTVMSIAREEQATLWDLFAGQTATADHFVPPSVAPLKDVVHHGKNSLLAFKYFKKRFCRAPEPDGELWGYNDQPFSWATGPGYFVARADDDPKAPSGFVFDYTRMPKDKPPEWPALSPNEGIGGLVFGGAHDYMRKVSEHVAIGRLYRNGKPLNYFILCREDPEESS